MNQPSTPSYHPPPVLDRRQTILWFLGGLGLMFLVVSLIFIVKLGTEGRIPFLNRNKPLLPSLAPAATGNSASAEMVKPPVSADSTAAQGAATFASGTESLLPPESAGLNKSPSETPASAPSPAQKTVPETVADLVSSWASAWERKDVDAYLAYYTGDFKPGKGVSHETWLQQRRERLSRPGEISISVTDMNIESKDDKATARFVQTYKTGDSLLRETKTLVFAARDGAWRIIEERVGN